MNTKTKIIIDNGLVQQVSITGGGKGSNNLEMIIVFANCAMIFDDLAEDFDTALGYILLAINRGEYTNRLKTVRYQVTHDYMAGYTFTISTESFFND